MDWHTARLDSSPPLVWEVPKLPLQLKQPVAYGYARRQNVGPRMRHSFGDAEHHNTVVSWGWHGIGTWVNSSIRRTHGSEGVYARVTRGVVCGNMAYVRVWKKRKWNSPCPFTVSYSLFWKDFNYVALPHMPWVSDFFEIRGLESWKWTVWSSCI